MSKRKTFTNKAFQKQPESGFNLVSQVNNFNAIFETKPLESDESNRIEKILVEGYSPGSIDEQQVTVDIGMLKQITSEIRAIGRQGVVLMGERVHKAKEILKPYRDGTFTRWLDSTFGTRKTGYNVLSYFELYQDLPQLELKHKFKKIPMKAAYALASRQGALSIKVDIIREHYQSDCNEMFIIIQEKLPIFQQDRRVKKSFIEKLIMQICSNAKKIEKRKTYLTDSNKRSIQEARDILELLLKTQENTSPQNFPLYSLHRDNYIMD